MCGHVVVVELAQAPTGTVRCDGLQLLGALAHLSTLALHLALTLLLPLRGRAARARASGEHRANEQRAKNAKKASKIGASQGGDDVDLHASERARAHRQTDTPTDKRVDRTYFGALRAGRERCAVVGEARGERERDASAKIREPSRATPTPTSAGATQRRARAQDTHHLRLLDANCGDNDETQCETRKKNETHRKLTARVAKRAFFQSPTKTKAKR